MSATAIELNQKLLSDIPRMEAEDRGEYRARRQAVYDRLAREAREKDAQREKEEVSF
jgi:hypothetical protein